MTSQPKRRDFLYKRTLKRKDLAFDDLIFPKVPHKLPTVLSQEEVVRLIDAAPNHRLLSVSAAEVGFRWKDYTHHGRQRTLTLASDEFLRRFVQHVLPRGFPRIRYFGFLANRGRARTQPLCRALLHQALPQETPLLTKPSLWKCPHCHGPMHLVERMTVAQLFFAEHKKGYRLDSS